MKPFAHISRAWTFASKPQMCAAAAIIAVFCTLRLPLLWYYLYQNGILDEKEAVDCAGSILARRTLEPPVYCAGTQIEMYAIPSIDSTGL